MQRGEGIVGDLGLGRADGCQERGLAGVRQADDAGIGDQLEPQPDGQLLAGLARVGVARRLVGRRLEMRVAETAVAAPARCGRDRPAACSSASSVSWSSANTWVPGGTAITTSSPETPERFLPMPPRAALAP